MSSSPGSEPESPGYDLAVVGIAVHLPDASSPEQYWANLKGGVESIRDLSDEDLAKAGVSPALLKRRNYVKRGVVLEGMEHFDAAFFGFSPKDAAITDPQQRHFLECAWEALEDAGHPPEGFAGSIGVFAGSGMAAYMAFNLLTNPKLVEDVGLFLLRHTGNDKDFLSTRVSYNLDLRGPSVNVQTACSTSLVAIHLACQSLLSGECDMALAGGVSIHLPHRTGYLFHENEILSPDGRCRAFDHRSRGTVFGSGAAVVVLRRLDEALADGDHVYAVIRGSAINNDGAMKAGYLAPSVDGQAEAVRQAIGVAGISADTIGYVEAHGTGTAVGDPIEVAALTQAFRATTDRRGFCGLGSVKGNIGHTDTAAGVASFIKVALALRHGELPPSLHYEAPNPEIDFASSPFRVNAALAPWKRGASPRRAGVSSLGVGGTNAHVVLEEAPERARTAPTRPWPVIVQSARTSTALDAAAARLRAHLLAHPELELGDVAWTLQEGRRAFAWRRAYAARDRAELLLLLERPDPARTATNQAAQKAPGVVFLFPGGGAQHPAMGRGLHADEPVFRAAIEECLALAEPALAATLRRVLFPADADREWAVRELERPSVQLPALFATEYALARLWMAHGVQPAALLGHSMGENTAACIAGVFTLKDALGLVALRGKLFEQVEPGGMLSVQLAADELRPLLDAELALAVENAPGLSVASGPAAAIERLQARLAERGVESSRIHIAIAAHSALLEPILPAFRAYLRSLKLSAPKIPFLSNLTGRWITAEEATDPEYWVRHLRNTVLFSRCVQTLRAEPGRVYVELGPGTTLSSLTRLSGDAAFGRTVLASMRARDDASEDTAVFRLALGRAWTLGVALDWKALHRGEARARVPLPTYPFERQRFWIEPGRASDAGAGSGDALEKLDDLERWIHAPVWRAAAPSGAERDTGSWLVFADEDGLADALAERLRASSHRVVMVREGEFFERVADDLYTVVPQEREHVAWLWEDLAKEGRLPDTIAHLWLARRNAETEVTTTFFHWVQEHGFYSLFFLGQALAANPLEGPVRLVTVTSGLQSVAGERIEEPAKALVLGPCRVLPKELQGLSCTAVDVELPATADERELASAHAAAIDALLAEAARGEAEAVVAWRQGARYVQSVVASANAAPKASAPAASANGTSAKPSTHGASANGTSSTSAKPANAAATSAASAGAHAPRLGPLALREKGVYWITGGLGGIGLVLAEHLARTRRARLVLSGSSPFPARERWPALLADERTEPELRERIAKLVELEALGAEVLVARADVANVEELRALLDAAHARFGPLNGLFHAAGRVEDALLSAKDPASIDRVFTPKVHGTLLLDELLHGEPLDLFVVFSSTSSVLGPAGQVDYAAANAFLLSFAEARTQSGKPTLALAWGVWQEVGMAARQLPRDERPDARFATGARSAPGACAVDARPRRLHPLLGERASTTARETVFENALDARTTWVLDEHRLNDGTAVLPGTGQLELARAALRELLAARDAQDAGVELCDVVFLAPLVVPDGAPLAVRCRVTEDAGELAFEIESGPANSAVVHSQGRGRALRAAPAAFDLAATRARCARPGPAEARKLGAQAPQERHLRFGPRWQVLREVAHGDGEVLARFELDARFAADLDAYALHPALLDLATGFALPAIPGWTPDAFWAPLAYGAVRVHAPLPARGFSHARLRPSRATTSDLASFDLSITDETGRVCVEVDEFSVRRLADTKALARPAAARAEPRKKEPAAHVDATFVELVHHGILPSEGVEAFERVLAAPPGPAVFVTSIDLGVLAARLARTSREAAETPAQYERPVLASTYVAPRDAIETKLAQLWQELLGVDKVGVHDDFFELGGYSLIAVRLFARIKKEYGLEFPLSLLFEAPTVERCAERVRAELGDAAAAIDAKSAPGAKPAAAERAKKLPFLVPLHSSSAARNAGTARTPFFLVAGMYGNVMNLRHLAAHLGADQPVYGIQARGLDGKEPPHETFEEMARDYLRDVKQVQPEGPYLIGGYSGGGITAFEMAQQLTALGEEVGLLVLLDTPTTSEPPLTYWKRLRLARQRLAKQGTAFFSDAIKRKLADKQRQLRLLVNKPLGKLRPYEFRTANIETAFYAALARYELRAYAGRATLFRPPLDEAYVLGPEHVVNTQGTWVEHFNGWKPYVQGGVDVVVVPGNHDNMVLEPNVRVLAARLRAALHAAQAAALAAPKRARQTT
ncbi:MAG: SDR family NAD(P)-dependent oxidoreductase [Planctomycetes bacterium]|nr:SDR family NAD(P)-dependent oxidoreductase [Planctomycetota bacterium]